MNPSSYLTFLQSALRETEADRLSRRDDNLRWGRLRAQSLNNPDFERVYSGFAGQDVGQIQTTFIEQHVLAPLRTVLPEVLQHQLNSIPIAVLPIRSVNACAAKAPDGSPFIIIDSGLLSMCDFFLETKPTIYALAQAQGMAAANEYVKKAYSFIIDYYRQSGRCDFPEPEVSMPFEYKADATAKTVAVECFVLAHELAHIYAGHLDVASTSGRNVTEDGTVNAEFYQLSWEQEYEADALAWEWYQRACGSVPAVRILEPAVAKIAPLYLFEYMGLIDTNIPRQKDRFSTHPPSSHRLAALLKKIAAEEAEDVFERAIKEAKIALNMPKL